MLIEFSVGNFRSFKEVVTFSMVAAKIQAQDKEVDDNNTFDVNDKLRLLKSAAIYGANASGKTNLIKALQFMKEFVQGSSKDTQVDEPIATDTFRLSKAKESEPSFFQVVFRVGVTQYRYGFEVNAERIVAEWLFSVPRTKEAKLFERTLEKGIEVGEKYPEGKGLEGRTRDNALFLSVVAQFNGSVADDIVRWFASFRVISELNTDRQFASTAGLLENEKYAKDIKAFVQELDLDIQDVFVETREVGYEYEWMRFSTKVRATNLPKHIISEIQTVHHRFDQEGNISGNVLFDMVNQESDGTKKLIALAGIFVPVLRNGRILFIDELDARLHPLIILAIIRLFNSKDKNPRNAQLLFTTHDTNLLNKEMFRRDQIWFAEKDRQGATHLYSLVEFGVRNDRSSLEADYIQGRFGAIPFVGDFSRLFDMEGIEDGTQE